jgi:hypothetical protein
MRQTAGDQQRNSNVLRLKSIGGEYGLSASLFRKAARPELGPDLGIFDGAGAVHR